LAFHVVLLAGGSGTRFWPQSRADRPKQLLALAGGQPLLVQSWERARKLAPAARIWVVTPAALAGAVRGLLPRLSRSNLIVEPTPRDTAPAVALACSTVAARDPAAIMAVLPTDHVVRRLAPFVRAVRVAAAAAAGGALVCLGVEPDRPATGFGYLRCAAPPRAGRAVPVVRFVEKPSLARARRFLRSGNYLWNAGMFVWRAGSFLDELDRTAPRILRAVRAHLGGRRGAWQRAPRLSVDYAVMERARRVELVPLAAGWDDVGSWQAAARLREQRGPDAEDTLLVDSPGSVAFGAGRLIAVVGLPQAIVVDTPDALLVVARDSAERVKQVVDELRRRGRRELL
jgi:mannose-1-phosphate guanylyltransferase